MYYGFQELGKGGCCVSPHLFWNDTLLFSFPPIIYSKPYQISLVLEAAGAIIAVMTHTAILFQTRIQQAKTKNMSMWQKHWRMWTNSSILCVCVNAIQEGMNCHLWPLWIFVYLETNKKVSTLLMSITAWITNKPHSWFLCCLPAQTAGLPRETEHGNDTQLRFPVATSCKAVHQRQTEAMFSQ